MCLARENVALWSLMCYNIGMKNCRKNHTYAVELPRCPQCRKASQKRYNTKRRTTQAAYIAQWHTRNPGYYRKRLYGLSKEDVKSLLTRQAYRCPICTMPVDAKSPLDHCHNTGKVRGILCRHCNPMLGFAKDKPSTLRAAADYLEKSDPSSYPAEGS